LIPFVGSHKRKANKNTVEKIMKHLTAHLRLVPLLSLILLACTTAYGQITPSADAYTNTVDPTTNYGAKTLLDVDGATQATYIQFNLSSIPATYTSADITKATLKLYVNTVVTAGSFNVDYVNGTWAENTITSSLAPALGTTIAASIPLVTADKNQFILIDVTPAVQAWLSGTANDGIALVANGTTNATLDSKESTSTSHAPELDIVFAGGGTLTGVTTASGSGLTGGGTSGTLNLGLLTTCTSGQVLKWNGSAWACATASGTGTITGVTAGTDLTGGGTSGNVTLSLNTAATNALYAQLNAANTFTGNQSLIGTLSSSASSSSATAVQGIATSATGSTTGVFGVTESISGVGVNGLSTATSGVTSGVLGTTNSPAGYGVYGSNSATTGSAVGVLGATQSTAGYGVEGTSPLTGVYGTSPNYGVFGSGFYGVLGNGTEVGTGGDSESPTGYGVLGQNTATTGNAVGVYGFTTSTAGFGVLGEAVADGNPTISTAGAPYGVVGASATVGVYGDSSGVSATGGDIAHNNGVWGDYGGTLLGVAVLGTADTYIAGAFYNNAGGTLPTLIAENETTTAGGEVFEASMPNLGGNATAIIGDPGCGAGFIALQLSLGGMSGCGNYTLTGGSNGETYLNTPAGKTVHLRVGNSDALRATSSGVAVVGTLSKGGGSFMIDHPLDPANKYLYHSFVESPDMMNIYNGNVTTDASGDAAVELPEWFESLNRDFRYQLTVIGQFAQAIVAGKVANHQFRVKTDKPNVEVSWQVTGIRQDAFANANRIPVEVEKAPADRGRYLYPEAIGQPATARIGYEAVPPGGEQIVRHRPALARRSNAAPMAGRMPISLPAPPTPTMQKHSLPRSIEPQPPIPRVAPQPHAAPLPNPTAQASKLEVNQR
jgi:hypothetical protein